METPEEAARRIFGQRAANYTTSNCHTDPQILARVVELSSPQPHWSVLDVATGTGHTAFALAPHVTSIIGIDLTTQMLAEADKLRAEKSVTNVEFVLADVHSLPWKDRAFDLVTCRRAAHHFSDIRRAVREMARLLDRGGRLVIDDRSVPEDDFADPCMNTLDRYHDESHVRQYRPSEWRQLLEGLGFEVEAVEPYVKHRPISALTGGVAPENTQKVHRILEQLDDSQRAIFDLREVDEQLHLNHWYVMLAARKKERSDS